MGGGGGEVEMGGGGMTFFGGRGGLQALIIFPRIGLIYSIHSPGPRVLSVPRYNLFKGTVQL
jgi:hypothetical protein